MAVEVLGSKLVAAGPRDVMRMSVDQARFYLSETRFNVVAAGRRSGKTAIAKRRLVARALRWHGVPGARFLACAPVAQQAENIFWSDLKLMTPRWALVGDPDESSKRLRLVNGAVIQVVGMDKPQRAEGTPIGAALLDEFADMKASAWESHLYPGLMDTGAPADLIGVPEGRNHFFELHSRASSDESGEWSAHWWTSLSVLHLYRGREAAEREIAHARSTMDSLTFAQEYEARFNNPTGLVYHEFTRAEHCRRAYYNPNRPVKLCFDFNVSPGTCAYVQELDTRGKFGAGPWGDVASAVIGEVYIPRDSSTQAVCRRIIQDMGPAGRDHRAELHLHGDPAGGARSTKSEDGSDWDVIESHLRRVFGDRVVPMYRRSAPPQRVRVNAFNTRLRSADGVKRLVVDPVTAPRTVQDLEAVGWKEGSAGDIDDQKGKVSHLTDGIGYYLETEHPAGGDLAEVGAATRDEDTEQE